ncbi:MAG: class I poly(R)-hydroxyalkanoic acid synthase [Alphaproteobacteria bacterium]|nr:class I poly(R)-hydroxyalkanoic acid synthase [Alphaproteobacteria bacterium]MCL2505037.1 class I poly(R)-hydroxyalkanoic acid synthase [Alphaproteobacteria bacterium]
MSDKNNSTMDSMAALSALKEAMEERLRKTNAAAEKPESKKEEAPQPQNKEQAAAPQEPAPEEFELNFDVIEWLQILMHVAQEGQKLIIDYIVRTKNEPMELPKFNLAPIMDSMSTFASKIVEDPERYAEVQLAYWQHSIDLTRATFMRMQGLTTKPIIKEDAQDKRFKAKDWQTNWVFDFMKQSYLSATEEARRLVQMEVSNIEQKTAKKIEFYTRLFLDATAPNNFWMTNPEVLKETLKTKGENLIRGLKNLLQDIENGRGMLRIKMSNYNAFQLGKTLAMTPGKVVYQNKLMQLIQFSPSTPTVHKTPFLIIPPWINKYYVLDLREKNSFIRYLVSQGHTVFCISWANPDRTFALTQFEDYMETGALEAMRFIKNRTGENEVNVLGYCIGGTLLAITQAYINVSPKKDVTLPKINSATYLVTLIDFAQPGDISVFIDDEQITLLEERMAKLGYLDANSLFMTFNLLRSNDLIWPYVINNYLLGKEPYPFDVLYWNADSTNLPAAMQSYYLRMMYLNNRLIVPDALTMKDIPIDLTTITTPTFMLATREDHIAPWRSTYAASKIYQGPKKFVLAGSGHIAGVINPPENNKYGYWTNDNLEEDPDIWLEKAEPHKGSWWPEWIKWLAQYSGEQIEGREVKDGIEDSPGSYVKVRSI